MNANINCNRVISFTRWERGISNFNFNVSVTLRVFWVQVYINPVSLLFKPFMAQPHFYRFLFHSLALSGKGTFLLGFVKHNLQYLNHAGFMYISTCNKSGIRVVAALRSPLSTVFPQLLFVLGPIFRHIYSPPFCLYTHHFTDFCVCSFHINTIYYMREFIHNGCPHIPFTSYLQGIYWFLSGQKLCRK